MKDLIPRTGLPMKRPVDYIFPAEAKLKSEGKCAGCEEEVLGFKDELSAREYRLSGLCQKCQDEIFKPQEEDDG